MADDKPKASGIDPDMFEKLGLFYLGRVKAGSTAEKDRPLLLYDSRDLLTHAVCVGMTGSGKTGLGIAVLEEAALDGIPALIIDPKGDLGNLMLNFPELDAESFLPWINPDDAARSGLNQTEFAQQEADKWRQGLARWGQDGERVRRLRDAADCAIFTPGSDAGLPVSVLGSFAAPRLGDGDSREDRRDRIATLVSGLLDLIGLEADPVQSREHVFL